MVTNFFSTTAPTTSVVGIDPATGSEKFRITQPGRAGADMIVAGDGYAYYAYYIPGQDTQTAQAKVMRVSSTGAYTIIDAVGSGFGGFPTSYTSDPALISNGNDGVLFSWTSPPSSDVVGAAHLTTISSAGISDTIGPDIPNRSDYPVVPLIQRQDGTFVGTIFTGGRLSSLFHWVPHMVAFDASGNVLWDVPNEQPMIATADNGVIGWKGTIYDQNGAAIGTSPLKDYMTFDQNGNLTGQSTVSPGWLGNVLGRAYSADSGALAAFAASTTTYATTFSAFVRGSASGNGASIQQVMSKTAKTTAKQLPDLTGATCYPTPRNFGPLFLIPTCGNINAIELLTSVSPDAIFQNLIQTFLPVTLGDNAVMAFRGPNDSNTINVTDSGQILTINLAGWAGGFGLNLIGENPFSVMTERFDPAARTISVVTLAGHPLAGWRYWRVYSIGTNDVVIETGAYDQPAAGGWSFTNWAGYYVAKPILQYGWMKYMQFIQTRLGAPQGSHLKNSLGTIPLKSFPPQPQGLLGGYWDYAGDFTNYILKNVCPDTVCN